MSMPPHKPSPDSSSNGGSQLLGPAKTIYLISPQPWDGLKVSKHHYARELAALGHQLYFIEPPGSAPRTLVHETEVSGLSRVSYATWFPYRIKFRARALFDIAMKRQAKLLVSAIGAAPDLVWDFDNSYQFADLRAFGAPVKILQLVDQPMKGCTGTKQADLVLAVGQAYLDAIQADPASAHVVPHGLGLAHAAYARRLTAAPDIDLAPDAQSAAGLPPAPPRAAFVGNLESMAFDGDTLLAQAKANPDIQIELVGPYSPARTHDPADLLGQLANQANVTFTGRLEAQDILGRARTIDVWLISYDRRKTPDGSVNPHKVLEYMATGRAILSSRLDTHTGHGDLVTMTPTQDISVLPQMLGDLARRRAEINAPELQRRRAAYALQFSYSENIRLIDQLLYEATAR